MRIYWYGDGRMSRLRLGSRSLSGCRMTMEIVSSLARDLGFTRLVDWSSEVDEGEGVAVFGTWDWQAVPPPGRDDLEADTLVIWVRADGVAGLFFAKAAVDTAAILSMIATYLKGLHEISELAKQAVELRARRAERVTK